MNEYREALFWIVMSFFIVIGICSLIALLGGFKRADPGFRKWATTGFLGALVGAVLAVFKATFGPEIALFVTLTTPANVQPPAQLVSGFYEYDEPAKDGKVLTRHGAVADIVLEQGGWQVKLPEKVLDKPVRLSFKDGLGSQWNVPPFYPSHIPREFIATGPSPSSRNEPDWWPSLEKVVLAAGPASESQQSAQSRRAVPKFNNYARGAGEKYGRSYYQWRVFVDEPRSVLDTIQQVEYVLHPTFPDPFQMSKNREGAFELVSEGWGEFTILITVRYIDGTENKTSYYLDLRKTWPVDPASNTSKRPDFKSSGKTQKTVPHK